LFVNRVAIRKNFHKL